MRLPIVKYPKIITDEMKKLETIFKTAEKKHFCEYITGLIVGNKATIRTINNLFLNKNDPSSLNKFITQAKWSETELNKKRIELEIKRLNKRPISEKAGRLIIDDTLAHHTKCSMEGLAYLYDHSLGHNVWAHNVVTSYYVNRSDQFPVDFRFYHQFNEKYETGQIRDKKKELTNNPTLIKHHQYLIDLISFHYRQQAKQTKTKLGGQLVQQAVQWNLPFSGVLFDSWYLRKPLIESIEAVNKDWIGACPKDRKVLLRGRWIQLQHYIRTIPPQAYRSYQIGSQVYHVFSKVLSFKSLKRQRFRLVASYPQSQFTKPNNLPDFYLTNRKDWEPKRILTTYSDRWPTETFNQDAKTHLGFEDYQLRSLHAIRRHWYLSFVAYSLLGNQGPSGHSRWTVKGQFASTGQPCQDVADELLAYLVYWIAQQLQQGGSPDSILQALLA